ncbi:hypothetical protein MPDQ_000538 [Monascus purpureus]|uniref:EF hand domain protein n=1 Tax=Monascus purpureus TaxID=5098 RepID=A0A507R590_MONPU|nr:hypothetical protein MPDQ_000538 [Monascus purpureus]BDD64117.1 hypothetical protein MAP00_008963 [Monascus purpureus]
MSSRRLGPISLTRYRPFLYLFAGVAAAYALLYIHNNIVQPRRRQPSLRRRNAIRRHRRNESDEVDLVNTPSFRAINHLEQLERQNGVYGTFRIETEDGRRVESGLLPSLLATRDQLMEEVGVPQAHAELIRQMMEDTFLESFLALDFPPSHTIPEGTVERSYLSEQLQRRGISRAGIERALSRFNDDSNYGEELRRRRQNGERVTLSTSTFPDMTVPLQTLDGGETVVDDQSVFSWRDGNNDTSPTREGQNLLNLLYHIAEDQARRDGYIHRGVTCNSCGAMPIQGIRYRCANCIDYDLCETCEAMQVHIKTHLFYKVRIPAPFLGNPRQSQPVWYPGKPTMLPRSLPRPLAKRLMKETGFENTELDALWDQFRCLANHEWVDDPNKLYMAIDRKTFDRCFVPNTSTRPPPPSLIYDRMFSFYDTNGDNLIGFEEFLKGLASFNNKSADERMRRIFRGYDLDSDGYVERKDFLRMFRAYYALSRELTRDMVAGMEDDFLEGGARDVVLGSQPISSAFPGNIPSGEASRTGEGKRFNTEGDLEIVDHEGVLRQDGTDTGDQHAVVGDAAVRAQFGRERPMFPSAMRMSTGYHAGGVNGHPERLQDEDAASESDASASSSSVSSDHWSPAEHILEEDIVNALGAYVPLQEVTDPVDRARIGTVVYHRLHDDDQRRIEEARRQGIDERWRRRAFYIDEEDGVLAPQGYQRDSDVDNSSDEDDSIDESHPPSPRSRSSSKVRFQDDLADDYDVRSNPSTSSRSIPVGERWGGFEIPEVERDVGKEILYQVTQQGFNELLDMLFKPKEDLLMEVYRTRAERKTWAREIELFEQADHERKMRIGEDIADEATQRHNGPFREEDRSLEELLQRSGYSLRSPSPPQNIARIPSPATSSSDDDVRPRHLASPTEDSSADDGLPHGEQHTADNVESTADLPASPGLHATEDVPSQVTTPDNFDPTLPQFRPNEGEEPQHHAHFALQENQPVIRSIEPPYSPSSYTSDGSQRHHHHQPLPLDLRLPPNDTSSPALADAEETVAKPSSPSPMPPLPSGQPSSSSPAPSAQQSPPCQPSPKTLSRWAFLNHVEREARERGGPGAKLNFEEFASRMNADRGRRLAFVGSWIEMASF